MGWLALLRRLIGPLLNFVAYLKGRSDANRDAKLEDHENADAIRDRVERNRDQRVRELDGTGWRD